MNNSATIFKTFFYSAAFFMSCFFVCSCENTQKEIDEWVKDKLVVDSVRKVTSFLSQEGKVKSKLTAPLMLMAQTDTGQYVEFPNTLHADFFSDSGMVESWLDARYGKYYQTREKVYLRDSVVVISAKGDTLRCHDLWWDQGGGSFTQIRLPPIILPAMPYREEREWKPRRISPLLHSDTPLEI